MKESITELNLNKKLEKLETSLWCINVEDREPKFEVEGDILKILTEYSFQTDRAHVMAFALKMLQNDERFEGDSIEVVTPPNNGNKAHIEATLKTPIGDITKVAFYAQEYYGEAKDAK